MPVQELPRSASNYARAQRVEIQAAVAASRRAWRGMGSEFDASWATVGPYLSAVVETAQGRVAAGAADYVPLVLVETGQVAAAEPFAAVRTDALVGVAGDGRPVESLLYGSVIRAKQALVGGWVELDDETRIWEPGASPAEALRRAGNWLSLAVGTTLSDTGRQAESLAMGVRPVTGYVRMLNPPSCSRCVVLAGKWYRKNTGFARHPGCDCRHIPASESVGRDLTVDPYEYFESLTPVQQDATFTKAGAEAIRADANIGQVVNARRGVSTAQVGGRKLLTTTEGTTRRGVAYREMNPNRATDRRRAGDRYFRAQRPRLMPETIQQVATDRADYIRLLTANGYMG